MKPIIQNHGASPSTDKIIQGLTASSHLSAETGHPGPGIRPCIASMLESTFAKGGFPDRKKAAHVIFCEFQRIGVGFEDAIRRVELWNRANQPPLRLSELRSAANGAYGGKYKYSCAHPVLENFCIGHDACPYVQGVVSNRKKSNDLCFLDYGWQSYLTNRQVAIYYIALPYIEKSRQIGPGGQIYANQKQIAEACGVDVRRLGQDLKILSDVGLIEYEPGRPLKWEGVASEVRRILPVPRPTTKTIGLLQSLKAERRRANDTLDTSSCRDKMQLVMGTK